MAENNSDEMLIRIAVLLLYLSNVRVARPSPATGGSVGDSDMGWDM